MRPLLICVVLFACSLFVVADSEAAGRCRGPVRCAVVEVVRYDGLPRTAVRKVAKKAVRTVACVLAPRRCCGG